MTSCCSVPSSARWRKPVSSGRPRRTPCVVKDLELAVSHFRKAAGHGDAGAQFNLALSYAYGLGVNHDFIEAHKWAHLAADQGVIEAGKLRDRIAPQLSPHEMDESYRRASETLRAIEMRRKDS